MEEKIYQDEPIDYTNYLKRKSTETARKDKVKNDDVPNNQKED